MPSSKPVQAIVTKLKDPVHRKHDAITLVLIHLNYSIESACHMLLFQSQEFGFVYTSIFTCAGFLQWHVRG